MDKKQAIKIINQAAKVYAIFYKKRREEKYNNLCKLDKSLVFKTCNFSEEIEQMIDRENMIIDFKKRWP